MQHIQQRPNKILPLFSYYGTSNTRQRAAAGVNKMIGGEFFFLIQEKTPKINKNQIK